MNVPPRGVDDARLDAYLDGELSPQDRLEVEQAAQSDPTLADRLRVDRELLEILRRAYAAILDEPIPARLLRAAMPRPFPWWQRVAAALACVLVGAGSGWQLARWGEAERVAQSRPVSTEAVAAHSVYVPEKRHAVEVGSTEKAHLDRWLSKRLDHALVSPDLREFGFELVGGRLLPDSGRPAAQYMYQSSDGERVTVYVRGEPHARVPTDFRFAEDRGFRVVSWEDDRMSYAVTGRMDRGRMERIAKAVHARF